MDPMRSLPSLIAIALGLSALVAPPAEARLGAKVEAIRQSGLVQGERMFAFEGRIGMRYRFAGGRHCLFGNGLLLLDTWDDGLVVQQTLVLPLPEGPGQERMLRHVAKLFVQEAGLPAAHRAQVLDAFERTFKTAKREEKKLDDAYEFRTYCDPRLNGVMLVIGLTPKKN